MMEDLLLDGADLDLLDILNEPGLSPRVDALDADEMIRDIAINTTPLHPTLVREERAVKQESPEVHLVPPTTTEAIMANATAKLRATGLACLEDKAIVFQSLEEFRETFYGTCDGNDYMDGDVVEDDECSSSKRKRGITSTKRTPVKRCNNPDAELIANATEEQMRLLGIDPNGRDGKQQRRRIRNRMSAQLHRERKAMYIDALEAFVRIKDQRIKELERQVESARSMSGMHGHVTATANAVSSDSSLTSTGGSSEEHSDLESILSSADPASPVQNEFSEDTGSLCTSEGSVDGLEIGRGKSKRTRREHGTNVRVAGSMRHILPMLSVVCMIALCFHDSGSTSSALVSSNSALQHAVESKDRHLATPVSGRRLMALPDISESEFATTSTAKAPLPTVPLLSSSSEALLNEATSWASDASSREGKTDVNSMALWEYTRDDLLLKLYPRGIPAEVERVEQKIRTPRYLRTRHENKDRHAMIPVGTTASASSSSSALVPLTTNVEASKSSVQSRVLMVDGKALLDPSMTLATSDASLSNPGEGQDKTLTMLLPTSSIRWGHDWGDSADGTTAALLAGLMAEGALDGVPLPGEDADSMYVELVCSISSAHLVRNVTRDI